MRRTGRVIFIFILILSCMAGMWLFQSWREESVRSDGQEYHNVYVTAVSGTSLTAVCQGESRTWELASAVSGSAAGVVSDLVLVDDKVVKIVKKPEEIRDKILKIQENSVTLADYGEVELHPDFVMYRIGPAGEVSQGSISDITVGSTGVRFVAAGQRLCAGVAETEKLENIRVILKNSDGTSYDMDKVSVTADTDFTVTQDGETSAYKKGEKVSFSPDSLKGTATVSTDGKGRLQIKGLKRTQGVPWYRGSLEISRQKKKLHVINELPLEQYLYSVVPSEMPTEYGVEALKAQAVCARSYAVRQMEGNRLASLGAHVDDSVSYQVYNNLKEDERSIQAVDATRDQVVTEGDEVVSTYFFSASCGSTSGMKDVWFTKKDVDYLTSGVQVYPREEKDLSREKDFVAFLKENEETLDSGSPWYRWQTEISAADLSKSIRKGLKSRYQANPSQIQTKGADNVFASREIPKIGKVKNIQIKTRGEGGVASMLEIEGTKNTVRVYTEYNIRLLLIGENAVFQRKDQKEVTGLSLLPSGYFYIEKKEDSYIFYGGGYGHGVGMSQNGANALAGQGKSCEEILTFYFPGTSVQSREAL